MQDHTDDAIDELHALLDAAASIVGFTGAGISTESGVPDFRTPGSPWMVNKPIPFDAFVASREARIEAWRRKFAMDDHFAGAGPNRGHMALARLIAEGRSPGVITQNIDGLHQASSIPRRAHRRASRQRHLRDLPELRLAARARRDPARLRGDGRAAGLRHVRRAGEVGDDLVRPADAATRDDAGA